MPQRDKKSWPKTSHKAVDWEALFEDTKSGFISTIAKAESRDELVKSATQIVQKLFDGPEDVDKLQAFASHLKDAIAKDPHGHDVDHLQTTVITLLRDIKKERIEEAQAQKTKQEPAPAKRKEKPHKKKHKKPKKEKVPGKGLRIPSIVFKGALALLGLLAGGMLVYQIYGSFGEDMGTAEEHAAAIELVQQYVTANRPSDQWEIVSGTFTEDRKIALEILVKDKRHLGIIASQSNMARRAFIQSLCPPKKGDIAPYLEKGWGIWITLTDGRTKLTAGTCPYIGLKTK